MNPRLLRGSSRQEGKNNLSTAAVQAESIAASPAARPCRRRRRLALPSAWQLPFQSPTAVGAFPVLLLLVCCSTLTSSSSTVLRGRRPEEGEASTWRGDTLWVGGARTAADTEGSWSGGGPGLGEGQWSMEEEEEVPSWVLGQERQWRNDWRTDNEDENTLGAFTSPHFTTKRQERRRTILPSLTLKRQQQPSLSFLDWGNQIKRRLLLGRQRRRLTMLKRDPSANPDTDTEGGGGGSSEDGDDLSLSITNNMDVLRSKLLRELIHRRRGIRQQGWISRNQQILNSVG